MRNFKNQILKKLLVSILLFSLLMRPMYYVGQFLYFQLNVDYIIENYCINKDKPKLQCNGKCHLAKQLTLTSDSDKEATIPLHTKNLQNAFTVVFYQASSHFIFKTKYFFNSNQCILNYINNYSYLNTSSSFKPPEIIFI